MRSSVRYNPQSQLTPILTITHFERNTMQTIQLPDIECPSGMMPVVTVSVKTVKKRKRLLWKKIRSLLFHKYDKYVYQVRRPAPPAPEPLINAKEITTKLAQARQTRKLEELPITDAINMHLFEAALRGRQ
jgi:hypothetical protein